MTRPSTTTTIPAEGIRTSTARRFEGITKSLHRALRRVEGLNLITHSVESVAGTGAKRKIYELTASGERVLASYLQGPMAHVNAELFRDSIRGASRIQPG